MSELPTVNVCCICKMPDADMIISEPNSRYFGMPICKGCNEQRERMKEC